MDVHNLVNALVVRDIESTIVIVNNLRQGRRLSSEVYEGGIADRSDIDDLAWGVHAPGNEVLGHRSEEVLSIGHRWECCHWNDVCLVVRVRGA